MLVTNVLLSNLIQVGDTTFVQLIHALSTTLNISVSFDKYITTVYRYGLATNRTIVVQLDSYHFNLDRQSCIYLPAVLDFWCQDQNLGNLDDIQASKRI